MDRDALRHHIQTHTKHNSYWEHDARGIPLCRVCDSCLRDQLAKYKPWVLGLRGRYDDAVEENIEPE
jgi:hypothetical protein